MTRTDVLKIRKDDDSLADSLGIPPEQLGGGCGCDRRRWEIRPCGHCACLRPEVAFVE